LLGETMQILIVEADAGVRGLLVDALLLQGCQVTARLEALDANTSYDLILADPGEDGALFSRLQRLHTGMHVPLVILSTSEQVLQKAWEHQIPWLRMPFRLNALYALVEQARTMDPLHQHWPRAR
jgi:DNA-binding response OmpR family regulator